MSSHQRRGPDLPKGWYGELRDLLEPEKVEPVATQIDRAIAAYTRGDLEEAIQLAEKAKAGVPRSGRVRELLGLCLYHSGDFQRASQELMAYRRMTGSTAQNHVIADCYRGLDRPDKALELCSEVSREDVSDAVWAEVLIVSAGALADLGEVDRALARTARGDLEPTEVRPHHLRLWYVRADLLDRAGRKKEAAETWQKIHAEDPDFYDVSDRVSSA